MLLNAVYKKFFELRIQGLSLLHGVSGLKTLGFILPMLEGCGNVQKSLGGYFKLYEVGLSFTEIYKLKKELVALFNSSPEINTFWKQNPDICPTQEMESSQEVMTLPTLNPNYQSEYYWVNVKNLNIIQFIPLKNGTQKSFKDIISETTIDDIEEPDATKYINLLKDKIVIDQFPLKIKIIITSEFATPIAFDRIESHYSHPAKVVLTQNNLSKFYDDLIDKFKAWG
ncbi:unnamed protein product [Mytilus coruscus]|uniref:Uncharacterized protein n=1 Tax=Mytilus coruscus TaxID=42192 RepID=A0A6J7ZUP9_MYTCO|nr:unnamed protein product [Mytilus coruscus]